MSATDERSLCALVVDDDDDTVAMLEMLLRGKGYEVLCATDGELALKVAQEHAPDFAIVDIKMPQKSGIGVCRELRKSEKTKDIPIFLMSAVTQSVFITEGMRAGADAYFKKPFDVDTLLTRIEDLTTMLHSSDRPSMQIG